MKWSALKPLIMCSLASAMVACGGGGSGTAGTVVNLSVTCARPPSGAAARTADPEALQPEVAITE